MIVTINNPVAVEIKFPLYFRAGASAYAVMSENQAIVAHWWQELERGFLNTMTAQEALREYQKDSEITADEFRTAAATTFAHIESVYQQCIR